MKWPNQIEIIVTEKKAFTEEWSCIWNSAQGLWGSGLAIQSHLSLKSQPICLRSCSPSPPGWAYKLLAKCLSNVHRWPLFFPSKENSFWFYQSFSWPMEGGPWKTKIDHHWSQHMFNQNQPALFIHQTRRGAGVVASPHCPLCDQESETINHLLVACVFSGQFWFGLL